MEHLLKYKLLNVPAFVWGLQILYVVAAMGLLFALTAKLNDQESLLQFQIMYVIVMFAVNVVWRAALKKLLPNWL